MYKKPTPNHKCENEGCKKMVYQSASMRKYSRGRFCSNKCKWEYQRKRRVYYGKN